MHFHSVDDREPMELAPGTEARTFWLDKMMLVLVNIDPRSEVPLHSHPHEQVGTVLSGELEMTIAGETRTLRPGDVYLIPGGVEHSARTTDGAAQVVDVFSPIRDEYTY